MTKPDHMPPTDTSNPMKPGSIRALLHLTWSRRAEILQALRQLLREGAGEFHKAERNTKVAVLLVTGSIAFGIGVVITSTPRSEESRDLAGALAPLEASLENAKSRLAPATGAIDTLPAAISTAAKEQSKQPSPQPTDKTQ